MKMYQYLLEATGATFIVINYDPLNPKTVESIEFEWPRKHKTIKISADTDLENRLILSQIAMQAIV